MPQLSFSRRFLSRLAACLATLVLTLQLTFPAAAACVGQNLIRTMAPEDLDQLVAATQAVPFASGNFWRATRGDEVITIVGTYHFDDPRHDPTIAALTPHIQAASTVLVEAGLEEEAALMDLISREPSRLMITEGPTLLEKLPPDLWQELSAAMSSRGIPGFMAAKFRPWYVLAVLSVPPCAMVGMSDTPKGLDGLVIDTALAADIPVRALEPYDTIFGIFDRMSEDELIEMLRSTLLFEDRAEDFSTTLSDTYFEGESRMIWEFLRLESYKTPGATRAQIDAEFARMEDALMIERNRAWIPVLTAAAAQGPVFAAFGALHLSGQDGVLQLLQDQGYTLEELPL